MKTTLKDLFSLRTIKQAAVVVGSIVLLSICVNLFTYAFSNTPQVKSADYVNSNYQFFGLNIPKNLNFAGEKVPQNDFSIKESLDRELLTNSVWQSNALLIFKRANRWFPVIEPILKKHGVPDDFKYIALVESRLTNAVSPRGATGFWQLIEPTARNYGLEINEHVDERYNVEKSTEAACIYFKEAHNRFGNWTLAAASYNLGMGGIESKLSAQEADNYYDLMLNEETGRYIYRVLALKTILQNPKNFGVNIRKKDLYHRVPTTTMKVDSTITDLTRFAINNGYNLKVLIMFNPWLKGNTLPNPEGKTYYLQFPKGEYLKKAFDEIEADSLKNALKLDSTEFINAKKDTTIITTASKDL